MFSAGLPRAAAWGEAWVSEINWKIDSLSALGERWAGGRPQAALLPSACLWDDRHK